MSTATRIVVGLILLAFADLNFDVVSQYGYSGFLELATANAATVAVLVDLTIALTFVSIWMWRDARRRGITVAPFLAVTALLGSIGPLLYLVIHGRKADLPA